MADSADDTPAASTDRPAPATPGDGGGIAWLFLLGVVVFAGTGLAFLADLLTGHDILRSLLGNVLAAVVLVSWTGRDSLTDPDSTVTTTGGAVGTGVILVGLYAGVAGVIVAATSPLHGRLIIGIAMLVAAVPLTLAGFIVLPGDAAALGRADTVDEPD